MPKFLCIGHRGAKGHEPENTLRSIRRALEMGADGIEIDVYLVDGEIVVIHDDTLERTTNGLGRIEDQTFEALRLLDAGMGEQIPTLREVFETVNHRAFINVELKGKNTAGPVGQLIKEYMGSGGWSDRHFLVSSFDLEELGKLRGQNIRIGPLFSKPPRDCIAIAESMGAYSIHTAARSVNEELIADIHSAGLKIFVYTVNTAQEIQKMHTMGVDGVFTDFPDRASSPGK